MCVACVGRVNRQWDLNYRAFVVAYVVGCVLVLGLIIVLAGCSVGLCVVVGVVG